MFKKVPLPHLIGIFLISFATLLLELALTRVLSVSLWYHFGFLIISTALLGFGAAGVTLSVSSWLRKDGPLNKLLALLSAGFATATVVCFWLMQQIPFDPFSLLSDKMQLLYMPLYYIVVVVPFYFSGLAIGLLLVRSETAVNRLYAFDLVGAGLGCAAIALVMPTFGGSGSVMIAAAFGALAGAVFAWTTARTWAITGAILFTGLVILSLFATTVLPIHVSVNKGMRFKDVPPVYSAWNTFSKIDVYDLPEDTLRRSSPQRVFIIDGGTAATSITDLSKGINTVLEEVRSDSALRGKLSKTRVEVAALGKKDLRILIIGAGAGDETFESLIIGAASVTAVELNPIIVEVQTKKMKEYWGGLYDRPEVTLVLDEGRNFIKRSNEKYDVIVSSHTISNAAVASGALSLAENYVLTREAFEDYLDHLTPEGVLFFTRPEIQLPRLFTTVTEILAERGVESPGNYLYAYTESGMRDKKEKHKFVAGFLFKKTRLTNDEISGIRNLLRIGVPDTASTESVVRELYAPGTSSSGDDLYQAIVTSKNLPELYQQHSLLLAPATDDKPFFNQRIKWSSLTWQHFQDIFTQDKRGRMALEDKPIAEITLIIILLQSLVIAAIMILIPLWKFSKQGLQAARTWNFLIYFAGLGLGFILIEIALIQRFNLYLGQPVYTYAVILAGLLIFTGAGSYWSERFAIDRMTIFSRLMPCIIAILFLSTLLLPYIFRSTLHLSLTYRIVIALVLLAPLGIVLGMPFPIGLRLIAREAPPLTPWAWGVNGFFTVIGSVTAIILGMAFGFTVVVITAAACYAIGGVAIAYGVRRSVRTALKKQKAEAV
jgi:hypothetical protein